MTKRTIQPTITIYRSSKVYGLELVRGPRKWFVAECPDLGLWDTLKEARAALKDEAINFQVQQALDECVKKGWLKKVKSAA